MAQLTGKILFQTNIESIVKRVKGGSISVNVNDKFHYSFSFSNIDQQLPVSISTGWLNLRE